MDIYIKKDINMGRLYNYYQWLCYKIYAWLCVFAQKAVPYFILSQWVHIPKLMFQYLK